MQTRFSNPVKNWYLLLIVACLIVSKSLFYRGNVHPHLAELFPIDREFFRENIAEVEDSRRLYYPSEQLACAGKTNYNLVVLTLNVWNPLELNADSMPIVNHMKKHGVLYQSHYSPGSSVKDGLFSLMYSLPATYQKTVKNTEPAIVQEFKKRQYEIVEIKGQNSSPESDDEASVKKFNEWLESRSDEIIRPYYLNINLAQHPSTADKVIQSIILSLQKNGMLSNTKIILTGAFAGEGNGDTVPLLVFGYSEKGEDVSHPTSHYDVMPTLLNDFWGCKKSFKTAGVGLSLSTEERDWLLAGNADAMKILDFKNATMTKIQDNEIIDQSMNGKTTAPRRDLILKAIKLTTKYGKPN